MIIPPSEGPIPSPRGILSRLVLRWRIVLARTMGISAATQIQGVRAMVFRHGTDRVTYWLQLILSMGIATYGLVLGSTGVVIGAMLISPLMGPITEISMGLVTGSPVLVLHGAVRTLASVFAVVLGSAVLSFGVPYHELNSEILSRTSPTLIDLYIAILCALAAAYTTVRQTSDTVSAAAGTAISIALVPPLCVVGWALGTAHGFVARGAGLLFFANFCAIMLFAAIAFFLLGYDSVDVDSLEAEADEGSTLLHRYAVRLRKSFGWRYGPVLRAGMPLVLVVLVYVPLKDALGEVAWKVRVRDKVEKVINELPEAKSAVRSLVSVEMNAVTIRLVVVGDQTRARKLKADIVQSISNVTGVTPSVEVVAVPDLEAIRTATAPPVPVKLFPMVDLRRDLDDELRRVWPAAAVGELVSWSIVIPGEGTAKVTVVHFGGPVGPAGKAMLAATLTSFLHFELLVTDVALPKEPLTAVVGEEDLWLAKLSILIDRVSASDVGHVCGTEPGVRSNAKDPFESIRGQMYAQLRRLRPEKFAIEPGEVFRVQVSATPCVKSQPDAGVADASPAMQ